MLWCVYFPQEFCFIVYFKDRTKISNKYTENLAVYLDDAFAFKNESILYKLFLSKQLKLSTRAISEVYCLQCTLKLSLKWVYSTINITA